MVRHSLQETVLPTWQVTSRQHLGDIIFICQSHLGLSSSCKIRGMVVLKLSPQILSGGEPIKTEEGSYITYMRMVLPNP